MATQLFQAPAGSPAWFVDSVERSRDRVIHEIVDLTPDLAKFILGVNLDNRSVRNIKVSQYASDMAAGNWVLNGEPIIVAKDGNLNDGQHRCLAVIESNATIPVAMLFGVDRSTRLTVDQGAMRTAADFLAMDGVPNAAMSAAIARMVLAYERSGGKNLNDSGKITSAAVRQRVADDAEIAAAATFGHTNGHYSRNFAAGSIVGFVYYTLNRVNHDDAKLFMERVCRGDGLKIKDPAHTLREKLINEGKLPRDRKITLMLKAWNFHRRGMKVARGSLNQELPFPALI